MVHRFTLAAALAAVALVAGCGSMELGTPVITATQLSSQVKAQSTAVIGQEPDEVVCPDDLAARVGAKTRCTLEADKVTYGITVVVSEIKDGKATFDITVDDAPQ